MSDSVGGIRSGTISGLSKLQAAYLQLAQDFLSPIRRSFTEDTGRPPMEEIENANFAKMLELVERFGHPDGPEEVRRDLEKEQAASEAPLTQRYAEINGLVASRRADMARRAAELRLMRER